MFVNMDAGALLVAEILLLFEPVGCGQRVVVGHHRWSLVIWC